MNKKQLKKEEDEKVIYFVLKSNKKKDNQNLKAFKFVYKELTCQFASFFNKTKPNFIKWKKEFRAI